MRSWSDAVALLSDLYEVRSNDDAQIELVVAGGCEVRCRVLETGRDPWIEVLVVLLRTLETNPFLATLLNVEFTAGSLCTYRGRACLRQTLPLIDQLGSSLVETIDTLGELAPFIRDSIRKAPTYNPGLYVVD